MLSNRELFILRHTDFYHIREDEKAAIAIAKHLNTNVKTISDNLKHANTLENKLQLGNLLSKSSITDLSINHQLEIVKESEERFLEQQAILCTLDREAVGIFISDKHNPYHRPDAWELTVQIINSLPFVDYISVQNDWNDNHGWGQWADQRNHRDKSWSSDIQNSDRLEEADYNLLLDITENAVLLAIMGNHDKWIYNFYRQSIPLSAEDIIAKRMQWLLNIGVLQFSRGLHENWIQLAPDLIWLHGKYAAKLATTNARNLIAKFTKKGFTPNIVFGHTHRGSIVNGHQIGIQGVKIVNNHSLRKNENLEFIPLGYEPNWTLGITICYFKPYLCSTRIELIDYIEDQNTLYAYVNGQRFEVDLCNQ